MKTSHLLIKLQDHYLASKLMGLLPQVRLHHKYQIIMIQARLKKIKSENTLGELNLLQLDIKSKDLFMKKKTMI